MLQPVRKNIRVPFVKQMEKLGGVPFHPDNNKENELMVMFYRKRQELKWRAIKKRNTEPYGQKTKKSLQYGLTTSIQKLHADHSGEECDMQTQESQLL